MWGGAEEGRRQGNILLCSVNMNYLPAEAGTQRFAVNGLLLCYYGALASPDDMFPHQGVKTRGSKCARHSSNVETGGDGRGIYSVLSETLEFQGEI